ncbi:Prefoldin subunit beta [uncultured archaeon]|nr:Prefoldin subunit beta [uncultured archaeon]
MAEDNKTQDLVKQQLQLFAYQKQELNFRIEEIKRALSEAEKATETYRFYGNILVKKDSKALASELSAELKELQDRTQVIEMQEQKIKGMSSSKKTN